MGFPNAQYQGTKIRFQDEDEELTTDSSKLDESTVAGDKVMAMEDDSMCEPDVSFVDGDGDKTSADYYFDSYSHFGNYIILCSLFNLFFFLFFLAEMKF